MTVEKNVRGNKYLFFAVQFLCLAVLIVVPALCFAGGVEQSLAHIRDELVGGILPLISVIGLAIAAVSFFTGNPQAKQHVMYAILGCIFGFGAPAIVEMIQGLVR